MNPLTFSTNNSSVMPTEAFLLDFVLIRDGDMKPSYKASTELSSRTSTLEAAHYGNPLVHRTIVRGKSIRESG